jgi:hypothetical protein
LHGGHPFMIGQRKESALRAGLKASSGASRVSDEQG